MGEHRVSLEIMGNIENMEKVEKMDETRFYQPDDLKVTRQLLKARSNLILVDV